MKPSPLSAEQLDYVKQHYANENTRVLADKMGFSYNVIVNAARRLQVKKSDAFLNSPASGRLLSGTKSGKDTRFKKGQKAHNKGVKMANEVREKVKRTWFKEGSLPHNTLHNGAITRRTNKGVTYQYIRISKGKWELLHRHIWEQANGPIKTGYNVIFIDKNTLNCTIENLLMVSDAELVELNSYRNYPEELKENLLLIQKLNKQIRKHEK